MTCGCVVSTCVESEIKTKTKTGAGDDDYVTAQWDVSVRGTVLNFSFPFFVLRILGIIL